MIKQDSTELSTGKTKSKSFLETEMQKPELNSDSMSSLDRNFKQDNAGFLMTEVPDDGAEANTKVFFGGYMSRIAELKKMTQQAFDDLDNISG